ncbi:hypothetical protein Ddye_021270 [Dipteronia dyeriana]|uniref:Uncharacterized protein n=1 Tax=Dipteronia dyeriana TaxID=168575 RepID=A0AAD9U2C9_9ROSI|nr:hypothetical protein Ddye_021270 [Dipteronia dyeriana]
MADELPGCGSPKPLTVIRSDIQERCIDKLSYKANMYAVWYSPTDEDLMFNVDSSAKGSPVWQEWEVCSEILEARCCVFLSFFNWNITIVSDSKTTVSWIKDERFSSLKHVAMVYDIRNFLVSLKGLSIQFRPIDQDSFAGSLV